MGIVRSENGEITMLAYLNMNVAVAFVALQYKFLLKREKKISKKKKKKKFQPRT